MRQSFATNVPVADRVIRLGQAWLGLGLWPQGYARTETGQIITTPLHTSEQATFLLLALQLRFTNMLHRVTSCSSSPSRNRA